MLCNDIGLQILEFLDSEDNVLAVSQVLDVTPPLKRLLEKIQDCKKLQTAVIFEAFIELKKHVVNETECGERFSMSTQTAMLCAFKQDKFHRMQAEIIQDQNSTTYIWRVDEVEVMNVCSTRLSNFKD